MISEVFNEDCMIGMARYPDKYFDLAVVDPPYGLDSDSLNGRGKLKGRAIQMDTTWDIAPPVEYFTELSRISKNQIIWGGNYFDLPPTRCVIAWDKCQPWENFSQWEMAWTSFDSPAALFRFDNRTGGKIHPTQKPVELYDWLYKRFILNGGKVIDTHLGSGSNRIAANKAGNIDFTGFEIDKDYFEAQEKRWKAFIAQTRLFG